MMRWTMINGCSHVYIIEKNKKISTFREKKLGFEIKK